MTWKLGFVLPNFQVPLTVSDLSGFVALASCNDSKVTDIRPNQRGADKFLDGFRGVYDTPQRPGAIIWRDDICLDGLSLTTFVDFRNIVALAAILPGWAQLDPDPTSGVIPANPLWSDAFDFHPGRLTSEGAIQIYNPSQMVVSHPETPFTGMPAPHLPVYRDVFAPDYPLLASLLQAWELRYMRRRSRGEVNEPLFRSLEMAYRALRVPISNEGTVYDFGTSLALWVSALEILAHPDAEDVNVVHVLELLAKATWHAPQLGSKEFRVEYRRQSRQATLVEYIYNAIYQARNTFLHGNPVEEKHRQFTREAVTTTLGNLAPLIYRTALMCYLGWDVECELAQRMAHVVTYHRESDHWKSEPLDKSLIVLDNQMYEDAFLRFLPT